MGGEGREEEEVQEDARPGGESAVPQLVGTRSLFPAGKAMAPHHPPISILTLPPTPHKDVGRKEEASGQTCLCPAHAQSGPGEHAGPAPLALPPAFCADGHEAHHCPVTQEDAAGSGDRHWSPREEAPRVLGPLPHWCGAEPGTFKAAPVLKVN